MEQKIVGIIVARMGSSRVAGKSMLDLNGKPLLNRLIKNVLGCSSLDQVVVATTDLLIDDPIVTCAEDAGVSVYRGHPELVLDRIYGAATEFEANVIVEIGGDCPFISADEIDPAVAKFLCLGVDYLNNYEPPTYPDGFDINIISYEALEKAYVNAIAPSQRVHPFSYLSFHKDEFNIANIIFDGENLSMNHWSIDFPEDVEFVKKIYGFKSDNIAGISDVSEIIENSDSLKQLNQRLMRPNVENSFWNAPSIMKDINDDVIDLIKSAVADCENQNFVSATKKYKEGFILINELVGFASFFGDKND